MGTLCHQTYSISLTIFNSQGLLRQRTGKKADDHLAELRCADQENGRERKVSPSHLRIQHFDVKLPGSNLLGQIKIWGSLTLVAVALVPQALAQTTCNTASAINYLHSTASFPASCYAQVLKDDLKWCSSVLKIKDSKTTSTVYKTTGFRTTTVTEPLTQSRTGTTTSIETAPPVTTIFTTTITAKNGSGSGNIGGSIGGISGGISGSTSVSQLLACGYNPRCESPEPGPSSATSSIAYSTTLSPSSSTYLSLEASSIPSSLTSFLLESSSAEVPTPTPSSAVSSTVVSSSAVSSTVIIPSTVPTPSLPIQCSPGYVYQGMDLDGQYPDSLTWAGQAFDGYDLPTLSSCVAHCDEVVPRAVVATWITGSRWSLQVLCQ
ncbi:hypothetical protein B0T16DRAFT_391224 [Cercophora newfieldiana]|uniref:Uncharacterized protein n=1 Tax=Cercophora newfieldiana TaxID=92897 RepID=A0AA39Y6C0_9PEZI|nr:hypothetical protein B0T16DRAFT_391224 [Cercophora newfieldiana]